MSGDEMRPSTAAARASAAFVRQYDQQPYGVWQAPGRVNLIGEHTDYNDGFVLPFALPQATAVAASADRDGPVWTVWSEQTGEQASFGAADLEPGRVQGWASYVAGIVWALREDGYSVPPARFAVASDVPFGAGLSSSAALESAVLTALADLAELDLPADLRPKLAQRAENRFVGVPCGIMDQSASLRARGGHALFLDCRTLETEHIPFDPAAAGLTVVVVDTRAPHQLVSGEYAARRADCERAARTLGVRALRDILVKDLQAALSRLRYALPAADAPRIQRRVRHVVTENDRVLATSRLLRAGHTRMIGPYLTASHASMRDDFEITVPEVDTVVEVALASGAHGARMTGGGFGGCVLALVDPDRAGDLIQAVTEAFAERGFNPPSAFLAAPAAGAHRVA